MQEEKKWNFFTLLTVIFVIIMPFYVIIKVFFENKIGIPNVGIFIKEFLIIILGITIIFEFIKNKILPKIDILDILVLSFIIYGIGITLQQGLGLNSIIYGGRYDFLFLIILILYKHGAQFLKVSGQEVIRYFLLSASVSLFLSVMVKFVFEEQRLISLGYVDYASNWTFSGGIPAYHGLENSGVKRFQGILEGPNAMGYFLIIYASLLFHIQKIKLQFHNVLLFIFIIWLVLLTYSRSALLGIGVAGSSLFLLNIKFLYYRTRKYILPIIITFVFIFGGLGYLFQEKIYNAVIRPGSTAGHFERMEIGINRYLEKPLGAGLATAGPAFRNVYPEKITRADEEYYIPESWFIQQLIEGGIIYFSLFILIFLTILLKIYKKSPLIFGGLIGILVMNIFLHMFESTPITYAFFLIIGVIIYENKKRLRRI